MFNTYYFVVGIFVFFFRVCLGFNSGVSYWMIPTQHSPDALLFYYFLRSLRDYILSKSIVGVNNRFHLYTYKYIIIINLRIGKYS